MGRSAAPRYFFTIRGRDRGEPAYRHFATYFISQCITLLPDRHLASPFENDGE
jgi:hypothetical protein